MTLVGMRFKHKMLGVGVVSAQENGLLTIDFTIKLKSLLISC